MRNKSGKKTGYTKISRLEETLGYPWWLVHRHHLHNGLVEVARQNGVTIHIQSRIIALEQQADGRVKTSTQRGQTYDFDLVIGSDGVGSIVRRTLFPSVKPRPPTKNAAFRAIVPYEEVRRDPTTRELVEDEDGNQINTMEVWQAPTGYIISYPIANSRDFNMVLSHFHDPPAESVQEVSIEEVREHYKDYDPRIARIIQKIKPPIARWPLLVTGPLDSWSNEEKNIVLMGDAAHSMTNHMAQGAATSMEDGAFLAHCIGAHLKQPSRLTLADAVSLYESSRMPKAKYKQDVSFLNGWIWHLPDGPAQEARDKAMVAELDGQVPIRSPNLYGDPRTVLECYGYDAEAHAANEVERWLAGGGEERDERTGVGRERAEGVANWFLPEEAKFEIRSKM